MTFFLLAPYSKSMKPEVVKVAPGGHQVFVPQLSVRIPDELSSKCSILLLTA